MSVGGYAGRAATDEEKTVARNAVALALRDGRLVRPEMCEGVERPAHRPPGLIRPFHGGLVSVVVPRKRVGVLAHHDDYAEPLKVRWLCDKCHYRVHHQALPMAQVS